MSSSARDEHVTVVPAPAVPPRTDLSYDALRGAIVDDFRASAVRRRRLPGERLVDTPALLAYLSEVNSPDVNEVVRARLGGPGGPSVETAIDETIRLFGDRPFFWWVGPDDHPPDLSARLTARGVVLLDDIPGMAMDLADLDDATVTRPPPELAIEAVLDAKTLGGFQAVITHGFPEDWTDEAAIELVAAGTAAVAVETGFREPNGLPTRWLGSVDGRPVATARLHTGAGVAGVYSVVTVVHARRRGYGEAMTRHALLDARASGLRIATLQSSPAGRGVYERIGFRELCRFRLHEHRPPPAGS